MKKSFSLIVAISLIVSLLAGCSAQSSTSSAASSAAASGAASSAASGTASTGSLKTITIGASPTPHAEILKVAKEILKDQGYDLVIKEFTDYVQPNLTLQDKSLDANYFQHQPYLDKFNKEHNTTIVSVASIHYEPLGIYGGKTKKLSDIKEGAQIAVPNDATNEARSLLLLQAQGLIKIKDGAGLNATVKDITDNPKKIQIKEVAAEQLTKSLPDVDFAVINGNYAISAGLNASTDALAKEEKTSDAAKTYANIIAVRKGDENREDIKALVAALKSDKVTKFINDNYKGAVVPVA